MAKKKGQKRAARPKSVPVLAAQILAECAFAVAQGMERAMATDAQHRPYAMLPEARDFWIAKHMKSIPQALLKYRLNWSHVRKGALLMATLLGRRAAELAMASAGDATIEVRKAHVSAASVEVKNDPRCFNAIPIC